MITYNIISYLQPLHRDPACDVECLKFNVYLLITHCDAASSIFGLLSQLMEWKN
jgi:hypothetical protein